MLILYPVVKKYLGNLRKLICTYQVITNILVKNYKSKTT